MRSSLRTCIVIFLPSVLRCLYLLFFLFLRKKRLTKKNYFLEKFEENQKIVAFNLWSLPVKLGEFWHMSMSFHHCFIDVSILQPFATRRDKEVVVTSTIFRKYSSLFYQLTLKQKFLSLFLFLSLFFVKKNFQTSFSMPLTTYIGLIVYRFFYYVYFRYLRVREETEAVLHVYMRVCVC